MADKRDNLMPIQEVNSRRTPEQHSADSRKAGIASGEARRAKKAFKEICEELLERDGGELDGQPVSRKVMAGVRAVNILADKKASNSDYFKAMEFIRDTIGEKPIERVVMSEVDPDTINEIEEMISSYEQDSNRTPTK